MRTHRSILHTPQPRISRLLLVLRERHRRTISIMKTTHRLILLRTTHQRTLQPMPKRNRIQPLPLRRSSKLTQVLIVTSTRRVKPRRTHRTIRQFHRRSRKIRRPLSHYTRLFRRRRRCGARYRAGKSPPLSGYGIAWIPPPPPKRRIADSVPSCARRSSNA